MNQILVRVRNTSKDENGQPTLLYGTESIITYKAFRHVSDTHELICQVDENGNEVQGNPNLHPEYRTQAQPKINAVHAADTRVEGEQKSQVIQQEQPKQQIPTERKKPGPKPKQQPTELQEYSA